VATSARDEREAPASALLAVRLPPLRERGDDVVLLAEAFLGTFRQAERRSVPRRFSRRAVEALRAHAWPGNVRELESRVRRAVVVAVGPIVDAEDLALGPGAASLDLRSARARLERRLLEEALARSRGNITRAAAEMGVSRPTLHALMNKLGLRAAPFGV
jgi:two-component system NtrC family response regulator